MIESDEAFRLTASERQSALWLKLLAHLQDKLAAARKQNDGDHPETKTYKLRGQISTLQALIDLDLPDEI